MAPSKELQLLLKVLTEREIDLGADDVAWAFDSTSTKRAIESWVREYLTPSSLLTEEERIFADKSGPTSTKDTSSGPNVSDQSFEDAISALETSTAAIEKQCRLLEAQRRALDGIMKRTSGRAGSRDSSARHDSSLARERSRLEYESDELASALHSNFKTAVKAPDSSTGNVIPNIERLLEKDDRLFDGLEKVLPHLSADDGGQSAINDETERLCQALKLLTSADIRARIDAGYLEGAQQYASHANGVSGKASREATQLTSLHAELDELCREIDGLSTMAVDNQHRNPIVHALSAANADSAIEKTAWSEYLKSVVQYSTARMDRLLEQVEDQRSHTSATKIMSAALGEILAASAEKHSDGQQNPRSPVKATQKGLKPLRLVQANLSDAQDPASQLSRHLDVRVNGELDASNADRATAEKLEKLSALRKNTEQNISDSIAQSLRDTDLDLQQLVGAVFAHSPYSTINFESQGVHNGIAGLEEKTQHLSERMRSLDIDAITSSAQDAQRSILNELEDR